MAILAMGDTGFQPVFHIYLEYRLEGCATKSSQQRSAARIP